MVDRASETNGGRLSGRQILVIDDEEDTRLFLQELLGDEGARVVTAPDGEKGLVAAAQHQPDVDLGEGRAVLDREPDIIGNPGAETFEAVRDIALAETEELEGGHSWRRGRQSGEQIRKYRLGL